MYIDDIALHKIFQRSKRGGSFFFTRGKFVEPQYGGIVAADADGWAKNLDIVPRFEAVYSACYKLLGLMTVGPRELPLFSKRIEDACRLTIKQYYLKPWIDGLQDLPARVFDLSEHTVESVNTSEEYHNFLTQLASRKNTTINITQVNIKSLLPIEECQQTRVPVLEKHIRKVGTWTKPIVVERAHNLILDGHHRFQVAKRLGLRTIPAVLVNYAQIDFWSLREEEVVDEHTIVQRAKAGNIYPNKTVKHDFKFDLPSIDIAIEDLM